MKVTIIVPYSHCLTPFPDREYKEYCLSPDLLTAPYFKHVLQQMGSTMYDSPQVIVLEQTLVEYFDIYEHWLLTGVLVLTEMDCGTGQAVITPEQAKAGYENLLACCNFASTLEDKAFLDALTTQLIQILRLKNGFQSQFIRLLTHERIELIVEDCGIHAGFFKLVAHAYARFATVSEIRTLAFSNYNAFFKSQVMQSMAGLRTHQHIDGIAAEDFVVGMCYYHSHGFYEACTQRNKIKE